MITDIIEFKKWSSHLLDNLSDCLICTPEKFQVSSTEFEPMTSVMRVQCSYQLSYEATQLWANSSLSHTTQIFLSLINIIVNVQLLCAAHRLKGDVSIFGHALFCIL